MRAWQGIRRVFRLPSTAARRHADVDAELAFHIYGRIDELVASGMSRTEAEREARERFGDYRAIEHEVERLDRRRHRRRTLSQRIEAIMNDLRYAVRALVRQPVFSLVIIATLTLGIGATSAIFHAVDRAVLRPLPYPDAERIVYLGMKRQRGTGISSVRAIRPRSPPLLCYWPGWRCSRAICRRGVRRAWIRSESSARTDGRGRGLTLLGEKIQSS